MKIYSLDVSTTNVGRAYIDKENKIYKFKVFSENDEDYKIRMKQLFENVIKDMDSFDFDTLVITRAVAGTINMKILTLEGMFLGYGFQHKKRTEAFPDVTWYSLIGNPKDKRHIKKRATLDYFAKIMGIEFVDYEEKWSGKQLSKITGITKEGKRIPDDISDAFVAGWLLDQVENRRNLNHYNDELQNKINKLSKTIKKTNNKISILKTKIRNTKNNLTIAQKQFALTNSKTDENKVNKRIEWLEKENKELVELDKAKNNLIEERQKLRDEKGGL